MKQKATALTATTVAVTSLLPSINQVETRTVAAQQLPTQHIQHIKSDSKILYLNTEIRKRNETNSLKKTNSSFTNSTELENRYIVNANVLNIRSKPNINSSIIDRLPNGKFIPVQETTGDWYKIRFGTSYGFVAHHIQGKLYTTVYAHMKDRSVQVGDQVQTGELLGHMGNTGHSFGQHHHFELHNGEWNFEKTNAVNPLPYLVR
ncbi:peptidoglycan DD-metalloendopeptidase family protein [Bacillus pseudomycoides]|uniref:peptidoglycan DD-metalloendopeptidase family protein n=1 Tax=Bacillus pseudomycoides TaxID=64104 RepID=UPI001FB2C2FF|nr:peptidoglycan DD-metalloendopeptidase family protein [Bacillus pseudomycoides]